MVHTTWKTHSVCVCAINQNVVLLCDAIDKKRNELLQHLVCDIENKICMAHRCQNCPGIDGLLNKLMETFSDVDDEEPIHFQQWQSAGRTQIMTLFLPRFEFLQFLAEKLDHLSTYSYIAKAQAVYLRHRKETLKTNECLIWADFAENYYFIVQDEIQSCYWSKESCTLHPVVIYALSNKLCKVFLTVLFRMI